MEQDNNNNPNQNFNTPERVGDRRQEYLNQRVFGERFRENTNRPVFAMFDNLEGNRPAFARRLNFDNLEDNRMNLFNNRLLNFNNYLRINNYPDLTGGRSTVAGSDYEDSSIDSSMDSRGVSRGTHLLSEASSNASDVEGLPFSDYEERFPELGNSSIEPKIVKKVKSDSRSK